MGQPGGRGNGRSPGPALLLGPFLSRFAPVLESTRTQAEASLLAPRASPVSGNARGRLVSVISSVASFQCPLPAAEGRDCKGNNFSPSPQAPKDLFSRAGTAVPRLRLQRYCRFAPQSKFFPNFFTKNFTPLNQHPANQQLQKPHRTTEKSANNRPLILKRQNRKKTDKKINTN